MKYIINLSIVFNVDTRVLTLKNDDNLFITLSKPAARLLCELIINNNVTLSREDIIRTVWTEYGFTPSTATLSNHISELRKAFESLGLNKEIIITVPKTGFRMEAEIHPLAVSEDSAPHKNEFLDMERKGGLLPEINTMTVSYDSPIDVLKHKINKGKNILYVCMVIIGIIAIFNHSISPKSKTLEAALTNKKCKIYNVSMKNPKSDFATNVTSMMSVMGIDCNKDAVDIYYTETRPASKLKIIFMGVCYFGDETTYQNCISYKIIK